MTNRKDKLECSHVALGRMRYFKWRVFTQPYRVSLITFELEPSCIKRSNFKVFIVSNPPSLDQTARRLEKRLHGKLDLPNFPWIPSSDSIASSHVSAVVSSAVFVSPRRYHFLKDKYTNYPAPAFHHGGKNGREWWYLLDLLSPENKPNSHHLRWEIWCSWVPRFNCFNWWEMEDWESKTSLQAVFSHQGITDFITSFIARFYSRRGEFAAFGTTFSDRTWSSSLTADEHG